VTWRENWAKRPADAWPRVVVNTITSALRGPGAKLRTWRGTPRPSVRDIPGQDLALCVLVPIGVFGAGMGWIFGLGPPPRVWLRVLGVPFVGLGLFGVYLDVLWLARPIKRRER